MKYRVTFRGKSHYDTAEKLSQKFGLSIAEINALQNNTATRIIKNADPTDPKMVKINLQENFLPLLTREFGIKKISNKNVLSKKVPVVNKNKIVLKELGPNNKIHVIINIVITLEWVSDNIEEIRFPPPLRFNGYVDELKDEINKYAEDYAANCNAVLIATEYEIINALDGQTLEWHGVKLRGSKFDLTQWANISYIDDSDGDCVQKFLLKEFRSVKYSHLKHQINELGDSTGVTIAQIILFVNKNDINLKIYDVLGKKIFSNTNELEYTGLAFIAYNNHIYPLNGCTPIKKKFNEIKNIRVKNCKNKLLEFINKKIIPSKVKLADDIKRGTIISSFRINNITYFENNEFEYCKEILKKFDMENHLTINIKKILLPNIIEKKYIHENINSFLPNQEIFRKPGYVYNAKKIDRKREISRIDNNSHYAEALASLEFLCYTDWRLAKITKNPTEINVKYFYIAEPEKSNILLPSLNLYNGNHLLYCRREGIKFKLLEEITADCVANNYRAMFDEMLKHINYTDFKSMIVRYMGKFARSCCTGFQHEYLGINNCEFNRLISGYQIKINDENILKFGENEIPKNSLNRKLIDIQLKDNARKIVYEKMKELKLKNEDIIQIKTDCISYYGKLPNNLISKVIGEWKKEIKEIILTEDTEPYTDDITLFQKGDHYIYGNPPVEYKTEICKTKPLNRKLHNRYAGSGKTTEILKIIKDKKPNEYIVLSPTHGSLKEFREKGINCDVVQSYTLRKIIPKEQFIIFDEWGMCDKEAHNLLYAISKTKREYEVFADFGQLFAFGMNDELQSPHYNDYLFTEIDTEFTNYRNKFTKEYYDKIKYGMTQDQLISESRLWSLKDPYFADVILCYRNKTRKNYNKIMLKLYCKEWSDVDTKIICKTNNLKSKRIYKQQQFTIINNDNHIYTIKAVDDSIYKINEKQLNTNIELVYAINLNNYQGSSCKSFYWTPEDNILLNGRRAYVLISRLIQK